ncbi:MAG: class I SAM-dependent methyltransferase [Bacteroidales bacterium]|jgi:2-polyprenyl-3-methyl-5-hydroxy-6-metoxy-1,4-benzoquinol methylase
MGTEKSKKWYDDAYHANVIKLGATYMKEPESTHYYPMWCKVIQIIKESGYKAILDLGCGPGQFGKLCLKESLGYLGWDFSDTAIEMAKKLNPENNFRFKVCGDLTKMDNITFPSVVTCLETLEHIEKDIKVLNSIFCKLLIFSVPNYDYRSHVRYFPTEKDVIERYGPVVPISDIAVVKTSPNHVIYIVVAKYE